MSNKIYKILAGGPHRESIFCLLKNGIGKNYPFLFNFTINVTFCQ